MNRILLFVVALLAIFCHVNVVDAASPGLTTSINLQSVNNIVSKVLPGVLKQAQMVPIPDIGGKKSNIIYKVNNFRLSHFTIADFSLSPNGNGVSLSIRNIENAVDFSWNYKHKILGVPRGSGNGKISLNSSMNIVADVHNQSGKPKIVLRSTSFNLHNLKIKLSKSLFSWLYNLILNAANGAIKSAVQNAVQNAMKNAIETMSTTLVNSIKTEANFGTWGKIALGLVDNMYIKNNAIVAPFNGEVTPQGQNSDNALPRHNLVHTPTSALFGVTLDSFVIQSLLYTAHKKNKFAQSFTSATSSNIPVGLNTAAWAPYLPALFEKYPNAEMICNVSSSGIPAVNATPNNLSLSIPMKYTYSVKSNGQWVEVFSVVNNGVIGAGVSISGPANSQVINFSINTIDLNLKAFTCAYGSADFSLMNGLHNYMTSQILPLFNAVLSQGIPIPAISNLLLTQVNFNIVKDAVVLSANVSF